MPCDSRFVIDQWLCELDCITSNKTGSVKILIRFVNLFTHTIIILLFLDKVKAAHCFFMTKSTNIEV